MDAITYAKNKRFSIKAIPPSNTVNSFLIHQTIKKSRQKLYINYDEPEFNINPVSTYCDADSSRIKYASPFLTDPILEFINSQDNLVDKILALNPKQIGIVNPNIDIAFDYGNQLHYLLCKNSIINVFTSDNDNTARFPMETDKIIFFNENNRQYLGYGNLNLNNISFASLLYSFNLTDTEINNLSTNTDVSVLYDLDGVRTIPYSTKPRYPVNQITGSYIEYNLDQNDYDVRTVTQSVNDNTIDSPFNFSTEESIFNENIIIDRTLPLWNSFKITLQKNIHYSESGNDISYTNPTTNQSIIDDTLKNIYSWKSALIVIETENQQWDYSSIQKPRYKYEFLLLVGLKTIKYKLTEKIESMFYITIGNNYINNDKFSKQDIFFIKAPLKRILNIYKPDKIHFFDLSKSDYGNICKNGLLFGMQSDLQTYIIDLINKKDNQFVKTSSKIENLYELFEQL